MCFHSSATFCSFSASICLLLISSTVFTSLAIFVLERVMLLSSFSLPLLSSSSNSLCLVSFPIVLCGSAFYKKVQFKINVLITLIQFNFVLIMLKQFYCDELRQNSLNKFLCSIRLIKMLRALNRNNLPCFAL